MQLFDSRHYWALNCPTKWPVFCSEHLGPQPSNLTGVFPSSVPSGQPTSVFRVPLHRLPSVPSTHSLTCLIGAEANSDSTSILLQLPSNHLDVHFLSFPSPVWCRQEGKERTSQHCIIDRKREETSESICPWIGSNYTAPPTPPVKRMPQLPGHLASLSPWFLTWAMGGSDAAGSCLNDFFTQLGWQLSLWGRTTSSLRKQLCNIVSVLLGIIICLIETLESS